MPTRRDFIQAGLTAAFVPAILSRDVSAVQFLAGSASTPPLNPVYKVVSDVRFDEGVAYALEAERLGGQVARIRGDITDFWFHDLSLRWKDGPAAIAGLTEHGPLFCLERLAWDHRMRVVFREWNGLLVSWVIA